MRLLLLSLIVLLTATDALRCASAQQLPFGGALTLNYLEIDPEETANASFSASYGRLIGAEFGAAIGDSADANCLRERKFDKAMLAERSRSILVRQSKQLIEIYARTADLAAYKDKLAASKGADAHAEFVRLRSHPDVRAFLAIGTPAIHAGFVRNVVEQVDRYALVRRIKLRYVSPLSTANTALLHADPTAGVINKAEAFVKKANSPALARYFELSEAAWRALSEATKRDVLIRLGPAQLMDGLDKELADVCVLPR